MIGRGPHNPTAYDDDFEDQPAQGPFYQWGLGGALPLLILWFGVRAVALREAELGGRLPMSLHGTNAIAYGVAAISLAIFVHCHYYWGNGYNQAWFAVLGKILSACGFIAGLGMLLVRVGVLGRK